VSRPLWSRIALFGAAWAGVGALGIVTRVGATLYLGSPDELWRPASLVHLATCLIPLVMWALCRTPRSDRFGRAVDALGLIASAGALALMARLLAVETTPLLEAPPSFFAIFSASVYESFTTMIVYAASMMFALRSALVPSRTLHTVEIGLAMGATMIAVWVIGYDGPAVNLAVSSGSLWVVAVAVCAVLSAVIYGLHREIEKVRRLGQYTLDEQIGEGGMGTVYRARHAMLRRPTAIKLLRHDRVTADTVARFEREVQRTAELTHPNTITVYDYGRTPDGIFYYAMELLDGATVQTLVEATGPQPPSRVVHVMRMVAGALAEAHGRNLIHRDIKPANIVLSERGGMPDVATVLDFGLVLDLQNGEDRGLTQDGKIIGTPMYLAPEVIKSADAADARSDLYALGAVAYFMLTGRTVFEGGTIIEICGHHLHSAVVPPSARLGAPVPVELETIVLRCLAKEPADRPTSAAEVVEALTRVPVPPWSASEARAWWQAHPLPKPAKRDEAIVETEVWRAISGE
jgi:eukaryotic-like serine/threonine-protein kinase